MTAGIVSPLACDDERRRHDARAKGLNGIDDIEVGEPASDGTVVLCVHFLGPVPEDVGVDDVRIEGGRRVCHIRAVSVRPRPAVREDDDDCLEVVLDRAGDRSVYRFCLLHRGEDFDAFYACRDFTFAGHCHDDLDCGAEPVCPPEAFAEPALDYLVKDYDGFRRLMLDRLALLMPEWSERHIPDVGVTLVELLAYTADYLSYYQDAVATEAYLGTARRRISVRRHGRLVDYLLHEGCNARAFVVVDVDGPVQWQADAVVFLTAFAGMPPAGGPALDAAALPPPGSSFRAFEPLVSNRAEALRFTPARNRIRFHTWGERDCCLPTGATSAWLVDDGLDLAVGDFLVIEEVVGPKTGVPADADPSRRHVVRLLKVGDPVADAVEGVQAVEVGWGVADALPAPFCISSVGGPACELFADVSVARGNVVPVDEGLTVGGETLGPVPGPPVRVECEAECEPVAVVEPGRPFRPELRQPDLTFAEPLPGLDRCGSPATAAALTGGRDPRRALPEVVLHGPDGDWAPAIDLLAAAAHDRSFVVEMDDDRRAWLRFGDGRLGQAPATGAVLAPSYRVGSGPSGNVGAEAIVQVALRGVADDTVVRVRNPLAASGGTPPEEVADAKLRIPNAFRAVRERAVTGDDYAELAMDAAGSRLQRAAGALVWTGSWYEAEVALDPRGTVDGPAGCARAGCRCGCGAGCRCGCGGGSGCGCDEAPCDSDAVAPLVADALESFRRMGHDVRVEHAELVPVDLEVTVCVAPHVLAAHVKAALLEAFSDAVLPDGRLGFFHPDNWSFGDALHASAVLAAGHAVTGVVSAEVTRLQREDEADRGERAAGVLAVGRRQVVVLSADATVPRMGRLSVVTRGGR
jgi:hypothetical protein